MEGAYRMKIQLIAEKGTKKAWFLVSGAKLSFLNALRRSVIANLPAFAIDEVQLYENTSPMFNEYLANRLSLIPLTFEETSAESQVSLSLDAEAVDEEKTVYSGDLVSQDEVIKPFYVHIPLIKLGKGQRLRFEASAVVNTAKMHAKFQSAIASYAYLHEFKLVEKCKKCGSRMLPSETALIGKISSSAVPEASTLCDKCETKAEESEKDPIVFMVESFNNVPAKQQLFRAIKAIEADYGKVKEFLKEV